MHYLNYGAAVSEVRVDYIIIRFNVVRVGEIPHLTRHTKEFLIYTRALSTFWQLVLGVILPTKYNMLSKLWFVCRTSVAHVWL